MQLNEQIIREIIFKKKIKHVSIARHLGMTRQGWNSMLLRGSISNDQLVKLAQYLKVNPLELIDDGEKLLGIIEDQKVEYSNNKSTSTNEVVDKLDVLIDVIRNMGESLSNRLDQIDSKLGPDQGSRKDGTSG